MHGYAFLAFEKALQSFDARESGSGRNLVDRKIRFGKQSFQLRHPPGGDCLEDCCPGYFLEPKVRKPSWCPRMDVSEKDGVYTLAFDMNPRLVASAQVANTWSLPIFRA